MLGFFQTPLVANNQPFPGSPALGAESVLMKAKGVLVPLRTGCLLAAGLPGQGGEAVAGGPVPAWGDFRGRQNGHGKLIEVG